MELRVFIASGLLAIVSGASFAANHATSSKPPCEATAPPIAHNLFIMLLTAPPNTKDPDWALQGVTSGRYESCEACLSAAKSIVGSIKTISTINIAGFCLPVSLSYTPVGGAQPKTEEGRVLPVAPNFTIKSLPTTKPLDFNSLQ
jgi:hypothetical protein